MKKMISLKKINSTLKFIPNHLFTNKGHQINFISNLSFHSNFKSYIDDNFYYNNLNKKNFSSFSTIKMNKNQFVDGKFCLLKFEKFKSKSELAFYVGINLFNVYAAYFTIKKFLKFQLIRGVLSLLVFLTISKISSSYSINRAVYIVDINLLEDGKRLEINVISEKIIVDISALRELDSLEKEAYAVKFKQSFYLKFYPIIINNQLYLINTKSNIYNKEIFDEIKKGKYISIEDDDNKNSKDKETIIDI